MQKVRHYRINLLWLLVGIRFQVLFTPFIRVLFAFPSRYWFTIGCWLVLRLGGWSPHIQTGLHVSRSTRIHSCFLPIRGYHPLWLNFPIYSSSYTNDIGLVPVRSSLTRGVSIDFLSSGYLDISVHQVRFYFLCIQL